MNQRHTSTEDAWEQLVLNVQKGEPYRVKFRGDPTVYVGIPIADPNEPRPVRGTFEFLIREPEAAQGRATRTVHDVEWIERTDAP